MISTEWGTPNAFSQGFNPKHIKVLYINSIHSMLIDTQIDCVYIGKVVWIGHIFMGLDNT